MLRFDRVRALPSALQSDTRMDHLYPTKRPQVRVAPSPSESASVTRPATRAAEKAPHRLAPPRCLPRHARGDRHGSPDAREPSARCLRPFSPPLPTRPGRVGRISCPTRRPPGPWWCVNACGTHEIRSGTDDAVPSQRSTRGQAPRRRPAPTLVTVVTLVRLLDNRLPCEILWTD
jgi:hypothetical protein